jgi:hypothetical protein
MEQLDSMDLYAAAESGTTGMFRAPRAPGWRALLADRRAARAALVLFDKMAERETARLDAKALCAAASTAAATVRPRKK